MAFLTFLFRQRFAVLGVLAVLAAAGMAVALYGRAVPVGTFFLTALSLGAGFGVAFVHLRHVAFAAITVAAPLPGMVMAGPFAVAHGVGILPLLAAYGFATAAGTLWAAVASREIAANRGREEAVFLEPSSALLPMGMAVLTVAVVLSGWLFRFVPYQALGISSEMLAGTLSSVLLIAFGALALPFGEGAVTEINRADERRALRVRWLTPVIEPRWGLSLAGIALVMAVLGYFGVEGLLTKGSLLAKPAYWAGSALLVFLACLAVSRDWRDALAAVLAVAVETLLGLWLWGIAVGHLTLLALIVVLMVDGVSLLLMLALLERSRRHRATGDAVAVARLKALETCAVPALYGCATVAAAIVPWIVLHGSMATLAMLFVLAAGSAVLGMPAIAAAIDALVRRRFSVEELYGRG